MRVANYKLMPDINARRFWPRKNSIARHRHFHPRLYATACQAVIDHNQRVANDIARYGLDSPYLPMQAYRELEEPKPEPPVDPEAIARAERMQRQATHAHIKGQMASRYNTDPLDQHIEEMEIVRGFNKTEEDA